MTEGCMRAGLAHMEKPLGGFLSLKKRMKLVTWTSKLFGHLLFLNLDPLFFSPLHNLCSCRRLCAPLVFLPDLRCGLYKGQIILLELFCPKPLVRPTQTRGDKGEWSGPGLGPRRRVLNIHGCFLPAPFSCRGEDPAHLVWIASHIIMGAG